MAQAGNGDGFVRRARHATADPANEASLFRPVRHHGVEATGDALNEWDNENAPGHTTGGVICAYEGPAR